MSSSQFIDYVKVHVRSGSGGSGIVHLRKEKFVPKGGPDGGDGGRGGHVMLQGNPNLTTLLHLKYCKYVKAQDGRPGGRQRATGACGKDTLLEVPLGTVVKDALTNQLLTEITSPGQTYCLAAGGRGGLGNARFKSATSQTPRFAQPGQAGQERWAILELKLLAHVGLVGLPNAGKSTLLAHLSAAKPKIADYPFTTLIPSLGMVSCGDQQSFVIADIPGLIRGAASGKGLGTRFLRHIERNTILAFVLAADDPDPAMSYATLLQELAEHDPALATKGQIIVLSKADLVTPQQRQTVASKLPPNEAFVWTSAVTGHGMKQLKSKLWQLIQDTGETSTT